MARPVEWTRQIPAALELLRQMPGNPHGPAVLNYRMLETLLGVSRRQALRIAGRLPSFHLELFGRAAATRGDLMRDLERIAAGEDVQRERGRRERIGTVLDGLRSNLKARMTVLPVRRAGPDTLPQGVLLEPGRLVVEYTDPLDLAGKLYGLGRVMADDLECIRQMTGGPSEAKRDTGSAGDGR